MTVANAEDTKPINPETHDAASGKSWMELAKEHERKAGEAQARLEELRRPQGPAESGAKTAEEYIKNLEEEYANDPVRTSIKIANMAANIHVRRTREGIAKGSRLLKGVKKDLRAKYEDFAEDEAEFDARLEDQAVEEMSEEGLKMVFHAIRGERLDAKLRKLQERKAEAEPEKKIVGPTSGGGAGTPAAPKGQEPLTEAQQTEWRKMGDVSETGYRLLLKQKQERARKLNVPEAQLPQTVSEPIRRP